MIAGLVPGAGVTIPVADGPIAESRGSASASRETPRERRRSRPMERTVGRVSFWLAVFLPVVYLPLLFVPPSVAPVLPVFGASVSGAMAAFAVLVVVHLLALVVGRDHADPVGPR